MKNRNRTSILLMALTVVSVLSINPAFAHSFNVSLLIPPSKQGQQIQEGFMLATKEQDSHPDQESDGHLGGLDVYINVIRGQGDVAAAIRKAVKPGESDILVAIADDATISLVKENLDDEKVVVLTPGQSPFSNTDLQAVKAFNSAYESEYGTKPSSRSAQGYNAARRIARAVRVQGGVEDRALLISNFKDTEGSFNW